MKRGRLIPKECHQDNSIATEKHIQHPACIVSEAGCLRLKVFFINKLLTRDDDKSLQQVHGWIFPSVSYKTSNSNHHIIINMSLLIQTRHAIMV